MHPSLIRNSLAYTDNFKFFETKYHLHIMSSGIGVKSTTSVASTYKTRFYTEHPVHATAS